MCINHKIKITTHYFYLLEVIVFKTLLPLYRYLLQLYYYYLLYTLNIQLNIILKFK